MKNKLLFCGLLCLLSYGPIYGRLSYGQEEDIKIVRVVSEIDQPFLFAYLSWEGKANVVNGIAEIRDTNNRGGAGINQPLDLSSFESLSPAIRIRIGSANKMQKLRWMVSDGQRQKPIWILVDGLYWRSLRSILGLRISWCGDIFRPGRKHIGCILGERLPRDPNKPPPVSRKSSPKGYTPAKSAAAVGATRSELLDGEPQQRYRDEPQHEKTASALPELHREPTVACTMTERLTINRQFLVATKRSGAKHIQSGTMPVTPTGPRAPY